MANDRGMASEPAPAVVLPPQGPIGQRLRINVGPIDAVRRRAAEGEWRSIGPAAAHRCSPTSTPPSFAATTSPRLGFTGNFIALACQSLGGRPAVADFDHFTLPRG